MDLARTVGLALEQALPAVRNEEAAFVAELQAGSEEAFSYLLAVYQNPVFNVISHIVEREQDAGDVLQEVFIKVFKGIKHFHGESTLKTWIYRIAVREASNHRRGWWRRHWREPISMDEENMESRVMAEGASTLPITPYQALEQAERQELVRKALASLVAPYRAVVVLRELEGLTYEEIAQVIGVAEGTVKSRLLRGRELLRRKLAATFGRREELVRHV
jgi:RNA polymerase sigma-70 factor (ECF subfamily)